MKQMVQITNQRPWSELRQSIALVKLQRAFYNFQHRYSENRMLAGLPGLDMQKIMNNTDIQAWLLSKYSELQANLTIQMDYKAFLLKVNKTDRFSPFYRRRGRRPWKLRQAYRRKIEHKPKEIQADAWRIEKNTKKDKSKRKPWHRGGKKSAGKIQKAKHRAWVRVQLNRENWDAFDNSASNRELRVDRWLWD
jgi:hypothetical protein